MDLSRGSSSDPLAFPPHPPRYPKTGRPQTTDCVYTCRVGAFSPRLTTLYYTEVVFLFPKTPSKTFMEVVLDRDAFLKGLQMVQNIVEPRQTLPILANVLLETDGETARLTATDLEVGARVTVPAKVAAKGSITISARKLAEIVKELP